MSLQKTPEGKPRSIEELEQELMRKGASEDDGAPEGKAPNKKSTKPNESRKKTPRTKRATTKTKPKQPGTLDTMPEGVREALQKTKEPVNYRIPALLKMRFKHFVHNHAKYGDSMNAIAEAAIEAEIEKRYKELGIEEDFVYQESDK